MPKLNLTVSELSILMSLALGLWEFYFFFFGGRWEGPLGWFTPDRLGFNVAWLAVVYISFQLLSIPFALRGSKDRFIGVVDGLSSIVPLGIALVVIAGKPELLGTPQRWEAAFLLLIISAVDLFGGYTFNIALSRRMMDVAAWQRGGATTRRHHPNPAETQGRWRGRGVSRSGSGHHACSVRATSRAQNEAR
jgi:hypothetical protein